MAVEQSGRLIMDPERREGYFARLGAERARQDWWDSDAKGPAEQRLWDELARQDAGAHAEETVGRWLDLLRGWGGATVFHAVEFRGSGLPDGDVDHLVLIEEIEFAVVVESKYRLSKDVEATLVPRAIEYAAAVSELTGYYAWPVLCQAVAALRDDNEEAIRRRWSRDGTVLLCDVEWVGSSIQQMAAHLEEFQAGRWNFAPLRPRR
jgi:hypothetical protein